MTLYLQLKHSTVAGEQPTPAQLQVGELAVNTADLNLFVKDPTGTIQTIGGGSSNTGTVTVGAVAPTAPTLGTLWIDISDPSAPVTKIMNDSGVWMPAMPVDGISLDTTGANGALELVAADGGTF